jgi:hypothetical protein
MRFKSLGLEVRSHQSRVRAVIPCIKDAVSSNRIDSGGHKITRVKNHYFYGFKTNASESVTCYLKSCPVIGVSVGRRRV